MKHVVTNREAGEWIKNELPFTNQKRSLWGIVESHEGIPVGYLPEQYHEAVRAARYVVFSYDTPIGWITPEGEKVVPDVGYSLATGQHQYEVAHAWGIEFRPARGRTLRPAGTGTREGYFA